MEASAATRFHQHDDDDIDDVNNVEGDEPLLIASLMNASFTYSKLFDWMKKIHFDVEDTINKDGTTNTNTKNIQVEKQMLPNELIVRILEYVTIERVTHVCVTATSFFSQLPLRNILSQNESIREQIDEEIDSNGNMSNFR
jgi:hypothetical protein